ncbi:unnamed protein product [Prunus armeniaca]
MKTIKDINAQVIEDPSLARNVGGQSIYDGRVIEEEEEEEQQQQQAEQTYVEATPSTRRKRKETARTATSAESPSPTPTKSKRLRKRTEVEYVATEGTAADTTTTSGTDEELREAFEAVEQEKELEELEEVGKGPQEKAKTVEEEAELPVAIPEGVVKVAAAAPKVMVEVPRSAGVLAVMTSPLKPSMFAMPVHSLQGSSATASFADPELA